MNTFNKIMNGRDHPPAIHDLVECIHFSSNFLNRSGLDGCRRGGVSRLGDGSDQVVDADGVVVVDLDARGSEVDLHVLDAVETTDSLLDLRHTRRAGEAFGAK